MPTQNKGATESFTIYDEVDWGVLQHATPWQEIPPPKELTWLPPHGFRWMDDARWEHDEVPLTVRRSRAVRTCIMFIVLGTILVSLSVGVFLWYVVHSYS